MQHDFYGDWEDSWEILNELLDAKYVLIPDKWYSTKELFLWTTLGNEQKAQIQDRRRVFLWRPSMVLPQLKEVPGGGDMGKYVVFLGSNTAVLSLVIPACYEVGSTVHMNTGMLSIPAMSGNRTNAEFKSSLETAKKAYKYAKRLIQRHLICFEKKVWIGRSALSTVKNDKAILDGPGGVIVRRALS